MLSARQRRKCAKCGHSMTNSTRSFHRFPKPNGANVEKARKWAQFAFPDKNWESDQDLWNLFKTSRVLCGAHFHPVEDFTEHCACHLRRSAVPRFNAPPLVNGVPQGVNSYPTSDGEDLDDDGQAPARESTKQADCSRTAEHTVSGSSSIPQSTHPLISETAATPLAEPMDCSTSAEHATVFDSSSIPLSKDSSSTEAATASLTEPMDCSTSGEHTVFSSSSIQQIMEPTSSEAAATPSRKVSFAVTTPTQNAPNSATVPQTPRAARTPVTPNSSTAPASTGRKRLTPKSILKEINETRVAHLTPRKQVLYKRWKKQAREIRRLRKKSETCSPREVLRDLNSSRRIDDLCRNMSPAATIFIKSQIRTAGKRPKGRRWTLDEKLLSLTIYKKSPSAYRFLRRLFQLPCPSTLNNLLSNFPLRPGINDQVLAALQKQVASMKKGDEACVLTFDEMSIKHHLAYNKKLDLIEGFEDHGEQGRSEKYALHALVLMVHGLRRQWKQPVAYYLSGDSTSPTRLKLLIVETIKKLQAINLKVLSTVCDMGTNNVSALKELRKNPYDCFFTVNDQEVAIIYDPPHLLKCTRNMLMLHNVKCKILSEINGQKDIQGTASWDVIKKLYELEKPKFLCRRSRALRDAHINPVYGQKMKVSLAAQVFSRTVGASILSYSYRNEIPDGAATASFLMEVDSLFDSFNGRTLHPEDGKRLKCVISAKSKHLSYWATQKRRINEWKYEGCSPAPPSQGGWMRSIDGIRHVWSAVQKLGYTHLAPRRLNQDPLENLFGVIRALCGGNANPNVPQFIGALKTAVINSVAIHDAKSMNCQADNNSYLSNLRSLIGEVDPGPNSPAQPEDEDILDAFEELDKEFRERLSKKNKEMQRNMKGGVSSVLSIAYVSGFIANRIFKQREKEAEKNKKKEKEKNGEENGKENKEKQCNVCIKALTTMEKERFNEFIRYKEYDKNDPSLINPSLNMATTVGQCANAVDQFLDQFAHLPQIKARIIDCISKEEEIKFDWLQSCPKHFKSNVEIIKESTCAIWLNWWIIRKNREFVASRKKKGSADANARKMKILTHQ